MSIFSEAHDETLKESDEYLLPTYLNGELDFPVDATLDEVYEDFHKRAPEIVAWSIICFRETMDRLKEICTRMKETVDKALSG